MSGSGVDRAKVWAERLRLLAHTVATEGSSLAGLPAGVSRRTLASDLGAVIDARDPALVWLALSVLSGALPLEGDVVEISRRASFDGGLALADAVVEQTTAQRARRAIRVTTRDDVLVDVSGTLPLPYTTGIQRVVRQTVPRWRAAFGAEPVTWTRDFTAIREITAGESDLIDSRRPLDPSGPGVSGRGRRTLVVPWRCTYLTPEVLFEPERSSRTRALARYAGCRTGAIAYDCVPLTSSETRANWIDDSKFSWYLTALTNFDRLAPISEAAATEYRGWRRALAATGRTGPRIDPVLLPDEVVAAENGDALEGARERFLLADMPLVLVVGSREPRKNHAAILHAAELLWRRGLRFSLSFVGGRSWGSDALDRRISQLQDVGRPIDIASGVSDATLAAAYQLARFTVFPSLNEGFGLPVAESLAHGTPVITSNFGSMREIAEGGGALMVDPRDDHAIADAMANLLEDDALLDRLRMEAGSRTARTWDQYAAETWEVLVERNPVVRQRAALSVRTPGIGRD